MAQESPSPARLEALSDGVIAVIITVMVLEIKVPPSVGWQSLRDLAIPISIYLLSFWFTAAYWLNHHHLIRRISRAGHAVQCANLLFLCLLSLLPFSTAYAVEKEITGFATAVYIWTLLAIALSFLFLRLSVHKTLKRHRGLTRDDRIGLRNQNVSLVLYLAFGVIACYFPRVAITVTGALTLLWIFPDLTHPRSTEPEEPENS